MARKYEMIPRDVPKVHTKHRTICTPIPVPESADIIERLRKSEPLSMTGQPLIVWDHAEDYNVYDKYGNKWIDFTSGVMITNAGHGNKEIRDAIQKVIDKPLLATYLFPTEERLAAAEAILSVCPIPDSKVFMLSSGTEAVECALKLMRTYAHTKHGKEKNVVVTFHGSFHGRSLGAQMLGGMPHLKTWIQNPDPDIIMADFPNPNIFDWANPNHPDYSEEGILDNFLQVIEKAGVKPENIAGVITEAYHGATCCRIPKPFIKQLRAFCDKYEISLFIDEIQAGFCRTGKMFAFEHYDIIPDIVTCAKGISGSLPLSAVLCRREMMDVYEPNTMTSTHSGSPLAAAATAASIKYLVDHKLDQAAEEKGKFVEECMAKIKEKYPHRVGWIGGMGLAQALELLKPNEKVGDVEFAFAVTNRCIEKGLLFFASVGAGFTLKICPPLTIPMDALEEAMLVIEEAIGEVDSEMK